MTRSSCKLALYSCGVRSAMHLSSSLGSWSAPALSTCSQYLLSAPALSAYYTGISHRRIEDSNGPCARTIGASVSASEVLTEVRNVLRDQRGIWSLRGQLQVMLQIIQRGVQGTKLGL